MEGGYKSSRESSVDHKRWNFSEKSRSLISRLIRSSRKLFRKSNNYAVSSSEGGKVRYVRQIRVCGGANGGWRTHLPQALLPMQRLQEPAQTK